MLLVNTDYISGKELETLGVVKGNIVQTKNFGKDFMAGIKTLVGGEITQYTEMLNQARQIAVKRMVDEAQAMGADAIVNVRYVCLCIRDAGSGGSDRLRHCCKVQINIALGTFLRSV